MLEQTVMESLFNEVSVLVFLFFFLLVLSFIPFPEKNNDFIENEIKTECKTISYSIGRWNSYSLPLILPIFNQNKEYEEKQIKIEWRYVSFSFCFLSPEEENQANLITQPLINMMNDGGRITLSFSSFSSFSFNNAGVLEGMNGGSVEMKECEFKKIKREEGNGSVIRGRINNEKELIIQNCSFDEIKGEKGNGGCFYIELEEEGELIIGEEEKQTEIKECSAEEKEGEGGKGGGIILFCFDSYSDFLFQNIQFSLNSAEKGKNLFIEAEDLASVINT
jgi:hypothetical protein